MTTPVGMGQPFGYGTTIGGPAIVPPHVAAEADLIKMLRALALPLPEAFMIPQGRGFNPLGSIATAAVQSNILIPGASVTIPDANLAVVAGVSIYITNMLATTVVQYTVLVNKTPVAGYQNLQIFPRVAPFVGNTFDIPIRVTGPALVEVAFNNVDGGAYTVGASLSGWMWPTTSDQRWKTSGV